MLAFVAALTGGARAADADAEPRGPDPGHAQAGAIGDPEQAERALLEAAASREAALAMRKEALADCARRVFSNRCSAQAEQAYRATDTQLRQIESRAREVLREARNRERYDALAAREREAADRLQRAREAEQAARERAAQREAAQAVREREAAERELAAAARAARHEARRQARERDDAQPRPLVR